MTTSVAITGLGIICSIGNDADSVLDSLKKGESGIGPMSYLNTRHTELPAGEVKMSDEQMMEVLGISDKESHSRTAMMGAIAIRQALVQAGLDCPEKLKGKRVTLISGTTVGGMDVTEKFFEKMKTDDTLLYLPQSNECGQNTIEIAQMAGLVGIECCTISTACSSALNSIIVGSEMLLNNETDIVIAGGSEGLSRFHLNGFNTLMILDKERCRPFDESRAGLNLGEGAAFVVLQKEVSSPLAFVAGYGNRCDAFHQTASSDDGEGAYLSMTDAIFMAGIHSYDIQYVNAHGTGTPNNDLSESAALKRVFGENVPAVSSTKGYTGHTTSASGSIEVVICILAMQNHFIPGNIGCKTPIEGGIIPTMERQNVILDYVLCNSFGFGGNDSSLVLSRNSTSLKCTELAYDYEIISDESVVNVEELPSLKQYISVLESRRMCKLMKAAMLSAFRALDSAGIERPDAIISATSMGMLEISQQFLDDIEANGEEMLKPTLFMQSTHNTIGATIAIRTRCHGYNITYSQGNESLEWAMRDAIRQIRSGKVEAVLVGSYDECTPAMASFASRAGQTIPQELYSRTIIIKRK